MRRLVISPVHAQTFGGPEISEAITLANNLRLDLRVCDNARLGGL